MVEAPATLANLHQLLSRALAVADELDETYVGAVIATALQVVEEKLRAGEPH